MTRRKQALGLLRAFLATEASGGILLLAATVLALVWANVLPGYESLWHGPLGIAGTTKDLQHWINDGLMTLFFFVVGLEIKRELAVGELADVRVAASPVIAAIGGMIAPALVYLAINRGGPALQGWAVPMATDIAFVVGALTLLGPRIPSGLKAFLLALAIVDDIGAIIVIAVGYTASVDPRWATLSVVSLLAVVILRIVAPDKPLAYLVVGVGLWWCMVRSNIHPTLAGVALGMVVPARPVNGRDILGEIEQRIHPVSSFVIVPLFALANAGVALSATSIGAAAQSRVFWGIAAGLVLGKTAGISGAALLGERLRVGRRPNDITGAHLVGGAVLSGIGFTVALFVVGLAFEDGALVQEAKLGVLAGSVVAAAAGVMLLVRTSGRRRRRRRRFPPSSAPGHDDGRHP